jgi:AraC-like DNA-binding protein
MSMKSATPDRCRLPSALWRALERESLSVSEALRRARLPAMLRLQPAATVTTAQYFALWWAVEDLSGDPGLGLRMASNAETGAHPPSSLAAFYARDYRDGLLRLARFKRLCTPETLQIDEDPAMATVSHLWPNAAEAEPHIATDITFATVMELGRRGTGRMIAPMQVELRRSRPTPDVHAAYFGCPVRYGAERNRMMLRHADLDLPFAGYNPELLEMLTPALAGALRDLEAQTSLSDQVKAVLLQALPSGRPDIADVAREMGMSERTLQRRITDEGTAFRELVNAARHDLSRRLLSDQTNDMAEVAYMLGYQDTRSFYRAFRSWEGTTPNAWRKAAHSARLQ